MSRKKHLPIMEGYWLPLKTLKERQRFSDNSWKSSKHLHQWR